MSQDLHRHDFYFILALRKGSGVHEIDFISYEISDNSIFFLRPGQVHRLRLNAGSEGYLMEFAKDFQLSSGGNSNPLLRKAANKNCCQLAEGESTRLSEILHSVFEEYTDKRDGYQEIIKASIQIFLIELLRQRQNKENVPTATNRYSQERLEEFIGLLETHINSQKLVSEYADRMSLSPFQLNSITKNLLGKTAAELIDDYILLESKRYLLATSNQVNQIAHHLGYEDVSYFIRFFKKQTGQTPESFRQNSH